MTETELFANTANDIGRAAQLLRDGHLVAFPTETVYGLGGDACSGRAVARIFEAKGRPSFNPLIAHVGDLATARAFGLFSDDTLRLATAFWPGPLTLVLPVRPKSGLSTLATAGLDTIGLRVPDHEAAQALLKEFGGAVAAPSANPSGRISPTTADHVWQTMSGKIAAVIDDGPSPVGLESTIVGFEGPMPVLFRPGGIPIEAIEDCLRRELVVPEVPELPVSPGQLESHYAPNAVLRLNAKSANDDEVLLGFGRVKGARLNLSPTGDLVEAAAELFSLLHEIDERGYPKIAVSPIPQTGLGQAINDRLKRAAAPR